MRLVGEGREEVKEHTKRVVKKIIRLSGSGKGRGRRRRRQKTSLKWHKAEQDKEEGKGERKLEELTDPKERKHKKRREKGGRREREEVSFIKLSLELTFMSCIN